MVLFDSNFDGMRTGATTVRKNKILGGISILGTNVTSLLSS